jgi:dolichol-phosphate mannosyltransferase
MDKIKAIAMVPTYNEKANIRRIIRGVLDADKRVSVLIVDDDSPDGTGEIAKKIAARDNRVHVLIRHKNKGRGSAGIAGFKAAIKMRPDYIIEMDADYSHDPKYIPKMISKMGEYDVVIGSRYVKGGRDIRPWFRQFLSFMANTQIRFFLGINIADCTSGYRCFRREQLEKFVFELRAKDPAIVSEVLFYCKKYGLRIGETPITFIDRKEGQTKLSLLTIIRVFLKVIFVSLNGKRMSFFSKNGDD